MFNSNEYALSKVLVFGETVPVVSVLDLLDEQDSGVVEDAVVVVVVDLIRLQTSRNKSTYDSGRCPTPPMSWVMLSVQF